MKRKEILSAYRKGPDHVVDLVNELPRTIEDLRLAFALQNERIKKLEGKLAKNSGNSSKPPSSDGPDKKLKTGGKRGGGKTGGQKGHRGQTLEMVATPDRTVLLPAAECEHCGCSSDVEVKNHEKRQEFEIPPLKIEVIEYIAEYFKCAHCGKTASTSLMHSWAQSPGIPLFRRRTGEHKNSRFIADTIRHRAPFPSVTTNARKYSFPLKEWRHVYYCGVVYIRRQYSFFGRRVCWITYIFEIVRFGRA